MSEKKSRLLVEKYLSEVVRKRNPDFKVRYKRESKLFKFLSPLIKRVNPKFFTTYQTTMFDTMWVTDNFYKDEPANILRKVAHEARHAYDEKRLTPVLYFMLYFFPQWLVLPFLALALLSHWFFIFPAVISLLPLPAFGRYKIEMLGFAVSRIWNKYVWKSGDDFSNAHVVHQLTSLKTYYGCWPFKKCVLRDLQKRVDEADPFYQDTIDFIKRHRLDEEV